MQADYKKYIYDYQHWIIYDNLAEKAKCFDIESKTKDLKKAYSMYEKCAIAHIAIAERRLGSMTINDDGTDADFNKGLGYYLMAAEDGDKYSLEMVKALMPTINVSFDPQVLIDCQNNNSNAMLLLAAYYLGLGNHLQRALEISCKGALLGNVKCMVSVAEILIMIDNELYEKDSTHAMLYEQNPLWRQIGPSYINNDMIFKEKLVVDSAERIEDVFTIFMQVLQLCTYDHDTIRTILNMFMGLVNKTNSYNRKSLVQERSIIKKTDNVSSNMSFITDEWIESKVSYRDVLYRGYEINQNNGVLDLRKELDHYYAKVVGQAESSYEVEVEFNEKQQLSFTNCTCMAFKHYPGICKHIVAVLYKIRGN